MILKTAQFKKLANKILFAAEVDKNAANLELVTKDNFLYLNVTNKEYYVSIRYQLDEAEEFRATVDAALFLNLISGINTDTFELAAKNNNIIVKVGKSNYKLAMIYENDQLLTLPKIIITNKTVEMSISNEILQSILNVNGREIAKIKNKKINNVNPLQLVYYLDQDGAFTFTTGSCLNKFKLDQPIQIILTDRIVKLFKLFDEDPYFSCGHDIVYNDSVQTKISFETSDIYIAAIVNHDDKAITGIQGPYRATKQFIETTYDNHIVVAADILNAAITRIMQFTKNSISNADMTLLPAEVHLNNDEITIIDPQENTEVLVAENASYTNGEYIMKVNLPDLKSVLDSCKSEHITINCGNHRSVIIHRGNISNVIPELHPKASI